MRHENGRRGFLAALVAFVCARPGTEIQNLKTLRYLDAEGDWSGLVANFAFGVSVPGTWIAGR